jgi:hypothetical protein
MPMFEFLQNPVIEIRHELRSKLVDGLLSAVTLYLLMATLVLLVKPFQSLMGRPGLLAFALGVLALSIFCLERSLVSSYSEPNRAWYGMVGGLLGWMVIEVIELLNSSGLANITGAVTLLMVTLIIATLWRTRFFPIGLKFYSAVIVLRFTLEITLAGLAWLSRWYQFFSLLAPTLGVVALICLLGTVGWLFSRTEWRIQRLWCALWLWFWLVTVLLVFRGGVV